MDKHIITDMAIKFLEKYSDELINCGCNDFDLKSFFPLLDDRIEFVKAFRKWNGDLDCPSDIGCHLDLPDFAVVRFISHLLKCL